MEKVAFELIRKFILMYFTLNMLNNYSEAMVKCTVSSEGKQGFIVESIGENFLCTETTCYGTGGILGCMRCCRPKTRRGFKSTIKPVVFGPQAVIGRIFTSF